MKDKPSEWVSISDLMAGVTAVVMLLLVISVVKSAAVAADVANKQKQSVQSVIQDIGQSLGGKAAAQKQGMDIRDSIIVLSDRSFEQGSACLSPEVRNTLESKVAPILAEKLKKYPNISIQIEGHTDALNVRKISTDLSATCALFDDNYSLSAGRAREARKAVLFATKNDTNISKRISVVGYGPDRLVNRGDPAAAENRRVEIRLLNSSN